jgi:hypothetical protein
MFPTPGNDHHGFHSLAIVWNLKSENTGQIISEAESKGCGSYFFFELLGDGELQLSKGASTIPCVPGSHPDDLSTTTLATVLSRISACTLSPSVNLH